MAMYFGILTPIITMAILYFYFKSDRFQKLRVLLNKLFWVDKLEEKNKSLLFGAKFTLIFYLFYLINFTLYGILTADLDALSLMALFAVGVPVVYRLIMLIQMFIFKV